MFLSQNQKGVEESSVNNDKSSNIFNMFNEFSVIYSYEHLFVVLIVLDETTLVWKHKGP